MPIRITGLNSGLDTESIISALVSSYNYKTQKYEKAQTKLSWKQDAWKSLNTKIYSLYKSVGNMRMSSAYNMKSASVSDSTKLSVTAAGGAVNGSYSVQVERLAKSAYLTGNQIQRSDPDNTEKITSSTTLGELGYTGADTIKVNNKDGTKTIKEIAVDDNMKISDVVNSLKDAGLNANFDEKNGRIFISSKTAGDSGNFTLEGGETGADASVTNNAWMALGLLTKDTKNTENTADDSLVNANYIAGEEASIWVNGVNYTNDSNTFSVNGLTITATGVTGAYLKDNPDAVSVTVSTDTQGIYDKIKDFLTQYNAIINEMTSLYNAESAKGYEPLTDEEREAMSESEIEKWEEKIKSSLLRRDDTLSGLLNSMTGAMSKGVEVNGDTYYLSSFGISTLGYFNAPKNEHNAYHIDGDEDDVNTSGKTDRLMTALAEDPNTVMEFMKGLADNLYKAVDEKMKSTSLRTVYTVYNDKEMASEYSDYTSLIRKWQERLEDQEEYYYKKFAAMETALSKINSQTSSLSGFFG